VDQVGGSPLRLPESEKLIDHLLPLFLRGDHLDVITEGVTEVLSSLHLLATLRPGELLRRLVQLLLLLFGEIHVDPRGFEPPSSTSELL